MSSFNITKVDQVATTLTNDTLYEQTVSANTGRIDPSLDGNRRINVALIGLGRMGLIHVQNLMRLPRVRLLYVLDADDKKLDFVRKRYFLEDHNVKCLGLNQVDTMMNDKNVEACIISSPTHTHEHYIDLALKANKHVLCEKPLAFDIDKTKSFYEEAERKKLKLVVAFNRRYDHSFRRMQKQVREGVIGPVLVIKVCSRDSPIPSIDYIKISGGVFHDCLCHDIDMTLWMLQELPNEVHAYAVTHMKSYKELGDFDTCVVTMKFPSGAMAVIDTSRVCAYGYDQRVEVFGRDGMVIGGDRPTGCYKTHIDGAVVSPTINYSFPTRYERAYEDELVEFLNHVEGNETIFEIKPHTMLCVTKIANAFHESAVLDQPIKLIWENDPHDF